MATVVRNPGLVHPDLVLAEYGQCVEAKQAAREIFAAWADLQPPYGARNDIIVELGGSVELPQEITADDSRLWPDDVFEARLFRVCVWHSDGREFAQYAKD